MFANLLVGYVLFDHRSTEPGEVGCTQRVVVVVQVLTVHATRVRQQYYNGLSYSTLFIRNSVRLTMTATKQFRIALCHTRSSATAEIVSVGGHTPFKVVQDQ